MFLSDGLPTTYSVVADHASFPSDCESEQSYDMKGFYNYMNNNEGHGHKLNPDWDRPCWYLGGAKQSTLSVGQNGYFSYRKDASTEACNGVSYSDVAAQYAQERAKTMKDEGYKIYSVGIGISKQKLPSTMVSDGNKNIVDCYPDNFYGQPYVTCNTLDEFRS